MDRAPASAGEQELKPEGVGCGSRGPADQIWRNSCLTPHSVRSRKDPIAAVEIGHRSVCICHLAAIALRLRQKLHWNPEKEEFTCEFAKEANAHVVREMRKPYDYSY